ncbi:MAG: proline dehydrogenase family protein [Candidatus Delongbacteria bacterium]|nr:proline dehydrogenase family protein [Candidatus Delongbacteria bacterium]MBN2835601.1 proline dehydrogenase family protein [Candidatus Delongbacteria bacterium]
MIKSLIAGILPYMPQSLVWIFSKKYIAGKSLDDAIKVCKDLNNNNTMVTIDLLGEFITDIKQAEENKNEYLKIIERCEKEKISGNYSLKPTMFGLLLDEEKCYTYIREIVEKAASFGNFVRVDMEDSPCTDMEIKLFRRFKNEFPKNVGLVLQAYLKRTFSDITNMLDMNNKEVPLNYRLCKGIYIEPEAIAFKDYDEINKHYLEDLEYMFINNIYPGIATHDKFLVEGAKKLIEKYNVPKDKYEFQMLYGVTPSLRNSIVGEGHRMRVYVPFGEQWFAYSVRRLKENPNMVWHIIKALFFRG